MVLDWVEVDRLKALNFRLPRQLAGLGSQVPAAIIMSSRRAAQPLVQLVRQAGPRKKDASGSSVQGIKAGLRFGLPAWLFPSKPELLSHWPPPDPAKRNRSDETLSSVCRGCRFGRRLRHQKQSEPHTGCIAVAIRPRQAGKPARHSPPCKKAKFSTVLLPDAQETVPI